MVGGKKNKLIESSGGRTLGTTETTWCKAVAGGGTGIVVLTFQISKATETISLLQNGIHYLKNAHPILRSKLHYNSTQKIFSFLTPPPPTAAEAGSHAKVYDISSTSELIRTLSKKYITGAGAGVEPIHVIQEHEMNNNVWANPSEYPEEGIDIFFATVYVLPGQKWIVALRFHTAACDRTTAESLLLELLEFSGAVHAGENDKKINNNYNGKKCCLGKGIEDLIPSGKTKKTIWGHGMNVLEYSLNSLRLTNLKFKDVKWPRSSEFVRFAINSHYTTLLLAGCKFRGIKFFGVLAAGGLMAAADSSSTSSSSSKFSSGTQKYAVATLIDCRTLLDPPLTARDFGFYHSAIINTHSIVSTKLVGGEFSAAGFWDLATRCYTAVENSKERNKHFSDMADLNFLMCKAIENPSLTASSSLRSSLISVVEETVVFDGGNSNNDQIRQGFVLEDYIGCGSIHGIGPSIAFFDTIRDGQLDCACVYPSPLHSRDQMLELVDKMKRVLIDAVD